MPALNPTRKFVSFPKKEIGSYARDLANLAQLGIPLPVTYCIPQSTLRLIAKHNHLDEKFQQILDRTNTNSTEEVSRAVIKTQSLITNCAFPSQVSTTLLKLYQQHFNQDFIRLTASPVDGNPVDYKREDNIKGETNMMDSILRLWANNIDPKDLCQPNLFPVAIIIQAQFQPSSSGFAYSLNLTTGDKAHLTILSVCGVFNSSQSMTNCDQFLIDRRSWQVVKQSIANKKTALQRSSDNLDEFQLSPDLSKNPSLNSNQIINLSKLINKIKLQYTHHILVHWELVKGEFLITKIKPFELDINPNSSTTNYKTILIGQSLNPGFLEAPFTIITGKRQIDHFSPGHITVAQKLTSDHLSLIHASSGFVVENGIEDTQVLQQLRHYQIPAIIQAKNATKILKRETAIVLDASAGKVYSKKQTFSSKKTKLDLQLLAAINDSSEITTNANYHCDGVGLIRSEHFFIKTGKHPQLILKNESISFKDRLVKELTNLYHQLYAINRSSPIITYRSLNLTSNQLAKLQSGYSFEQTETNPFLGFRGALRAIAKPSILKLELDILNKVNSRLDDQINLMLPFVRSSFELKQIWDLIDNNTNAHVHQPPIWLQVTTPENLINFQEYLCVPLAAVAINVRTIHSLMLGIDPTQTDIYNQYTLNHDVFLPLLAKVVSMVQSQQDHPLRVYLIMSEFDQQLLEFAKDNKITGIIAKNNHLEQIASYLS